ncbi:hypothetical protein SAMN05660653_01888 [Desulfonatronum thiosulfatophilum]|uniref:Uncharacterized protein n=1 Tax=Desulfonatronum thiosulfatophilum TaxID=617002 RepID=A0A1G6D3I8_9BACT|nr:hypothetical protein SAMN05660653_01888 [Desulfonatronum thiosulfatophilum]
MLDGLLNELSSQEIVRREDRKTLTQGESLLRIQKQKPFQPWLKRF